MSILFILGAAIFSTMAISFLIVPIVIATILYVAYLFIRWILSYIKKGDFTELKSGILLFIIAIYLWSVLG